MSVKSCLLTHSKNTQYYLPDVKASVERQTAKGVQDEVAWAKALDARIKKLDMKLSEAYETVAKEYEAKNGPIKGGMNTVATVEAKIEEFTRDKLNGLKLSVVQTADEAMAELKAMGAGKAAVSSIGDGTQGFAWNGRAWLIADNIRPGKEGAVFLHEVGSHLGLENILTKEQIQKLVKQIQAWALDTESEAWEYAFRAVERAANSKEEGARKDHEVLAYFIESAVAGGVQPSATSKMGQFLQNVINAFKRALNKLGVKTEGLTTQDYVDLAYGAAQMEMRSGVNADKAPFPVNAETARQLKTVLGGSAKIDFKLEMLANMTGTPAWKALVNNIAPLLAANPPKFVFHNFNPTDANGNEIAAAYVASTNSIEFGPAGLNMKTVLHELVHAVTVKRLEEALAAKRIPEAQRTAEQRVAASALYDLEKIFKNLKSDGSYGFSDVAEMVAEAFSNPEFQAKLRAQKPIDVLPPAASRFTQLVNAIKNALKLGATPTSVLEQVMDASAIFFDATPAAGTSTGTYADMAANLPPQLRTTSDAVWSYIKSKGQAVSFATTFGRDFAEMVQGVLPSAQAYFDLIGEKGALRRHWELKIAQIAHDVSRLKSDEKKHLGEFLKQSTLSNKWGYKPTWLKKDITIDKDQEAAWDALSKEQQRIADEMFQHGNESLNEKRKVLNQEISAEFDEMLRVAAGTPQEKQIRKDMAARIRREGVELAQIEGPYVPLKRFGDNVVVGKSQELLDAEAAKNTKLIEKLKGDEKHYYVEFFDSEIAAVTKREEIKSKFPAYHSASKKQEYVKGLDQAPFAQLQKLKEMISVNLTKEEAGKGMVQINRAMSELYVNTLEEMHARKSELKRIGVAGANADEMFRAFEAQGRADAHLISSLTKNKETVAAISRLRDEAKSARGTEDSMEASKALNEVLKRQAAMFDYKESPLTSKFMGFTSQWLLLSSPMYMVQNLTQPWMVSVPFVAARHGYRKTVDAFTQAYADLGPLVKQMKVFKRGDTVAMDMRGVRNTTGDANFGEQQLLDRMRDLGLLDIGMESEMGADLDMGKVTRVVDSVTKKLRDTARNVEIINRASTSIAAYRLAFNDQDPNASPEAKHAAATKYAIEATWKTHGDFSSFNTPRFMQGNVMRLMTQFRKFQVMMVTLILRQSATMLRGINSTDPKVRAEAKVAARMLAFTFGHAAVVTGALGIPGANLIAMVASALMGGDDEPDKDFETEMRKLMGEDMAGLLLRGAPTLAGVDLRRIGLGNIASLFPFVDPSLESISGRDAYAKTLLAMMGPGIGGVGARMADGVEAAQKGFYWKAFEGFAPKGLGDASKAWRQSTEGVTSKSGDVIFNDVSGWEALQQLIGQPSESTYERGRKRQFGEQGWAYKQDYKKAEENLTRAYERAAKEKNAEGMKTLRARWKKLQATKKEVGLKPISVSTLVRAPANQRKREKEKQKLL